MKRKGYTVVGIGGLVIASVVAGLILAARLNITTATNATEAKIWSEKPDTVAAQGPGGSQSCVPASFAPLVDKVKGAVVNISTTKIIKTSPMAQPFGGPMGEQFKQFFGPHFFEQFMGPGGPQEYKEHALGSGFIVNKEGYILTNNHVIAGMTDIRVITDSGDQYTAKVIGADSQTDIALLKVAPDKPLSAAYLGDSSKVNVGDWVVVIGNPFGLDHTVTAGIISAEGRRLNSSNYDQFLQTDAAINRGNSGGPVFDLNGEVIGISTAIIAPSIGQGIGFAIPINVAKTIIPQLIEHGKVVRGWLGVYIQNITPDLAESFHLNRDQKGAVVTKVVKGGPADRAGIKEGDVIVSFNDKKVKSADALPWIVSNTAIGSIASVTIIRHGKEKAFKVKIGTLPGNAKLASVTPEVKKISEKKLGIIVETITPDVQKQYSIQTAKGVVVTDVIQGSPADMAGIQKGDVIEQMDQKEVTSAEEYSKVLSSVKN
ncbi:MAG: Do family serine endopeptidase [Deltaproteobacteria bacterium]|nr:Do family serine endopeptidase [Deltaproteobacteria bacterium]